MKENNLPQDTKMDKKNFSAFRKGSMLAYALIIITMMVSISVIVTTTTLIEKKSSSSTEFSVQSYQTADSGVMLALEKINKITTDPETTLLSDIDFFSHSCVDDLVSGLGSVKDIEADASIPESTYDLIFLDESGNQLPCGSFIKDVDSVKSTGKYRGTVRTVEVKTADPDPCEGEEEVIYGNGPLDDGGPYHTIAIGSQCWLKENLNFGETTNSQDGDCAAIGKYCFGDCSTYGGLYTWEEAMCKNTAGSSEDICPDGWYIPTHGDFLTLEVEICHSLDPTKSYADCQAVFLPTTAGWRGTTFGEGTELKQSGANKFEALLGGRYSSSLIDQGSRGVFWTSTNTEGVIDDDPTAWAREISNGRDDINALLGGKSSGFSVRCIKTGCVPQTCASLGYECGSHPDGCGSYTPPCGGCGVDKSCVSGHCMCSDANFEDCDDDGSCECDVSAGSFKHCSATKNMCVGPCDGETSVVDSEGNSYDIVEIGSQCWMAENLNVGQWINKDDLLEEKQEQFVGTCVSDGNMEKYCYGNTEASCSTSGGFYTFGEALQCQTPANDDECGKIIQGVCPSGWHIPSDACSTDDFGTLSQFITNGSPSGQDSLGGKLKSTGINHWLAPNTGATDEYGFNALPLGALWMPGFTSGYANEKAYFWTSATDNDYNKKAKFLLYNDAKLGTYPVQHIDFALSVRCVKNQ